MDNTTECITYLLCLTSIEDFASALTELNEKPLIAARAVHWIFPPTNLGVDKLLTSKWDMVVCFVAPFSMPASLAPLIQSSWTFSFMAPSSFVTSLETTQAELATNVPARSRELDRLTDLDANEDSSGHSFVDSAEMTGKLKRWMETFSERENHPPVIMLNLLAFKDMEKYRKYQAAFMAGVGQRHGATPLLFGEVTAHSEQAKEWNDTAFVYYPSVLHFADMLASPDYQEMSHKYRQGSLIDNPLLCLV